MNVLASVRVNITRLSRFWQNITLSARVCLALWVLAGLFGLTRIISLGPQLTFAARSGEGEYQRRFTTWSPIYGFPTACASHLAPGTRILLVDPVDMSALPDMSKTYDDEDLATFAYTLYPHVVVPLGQVPPDWQPLATGYDYISVWEQHEYRSARAIAQALSAAKKLKTSRSVHQVCAYQDGAGRTGTLFAISDRARAALVSSTSASTSLSTADSASRSSAVTNTPGSYLLTLLGLASLWLIGCITLMALAGAAIAHRLLVTVALPFGCLCAGLELLLTSLLGIPWAPTWLLIPWAIVLGFAVWRNRLVLSLDAIERVWSGMKSFTPCLLALDERIALGTLMLVAAATTVLAPFGLPNYDGLYFYYYKAQAFLFDRSIVPYYSHAGDLAFSIPAHPPLVSLCLAWFGLISGVLDEHATLLLWPALLVSLQSGFYVLVRYIVSRRMALWSTLSLTLVGFPLTTLALSESGYTDVPLAVFLFFGCGLLWAWSTLEAKNSFLLLLAGAFMGAAALTKEEGTIAVLLALAISPLLVLWRRPKRTGGRAWQPLLWSGSICAVCLIPWFVVRARYPMPEMLVYTHGISAVLIHRLIVVCLGFGIRIVAYWLAPIALLVVWAVGRTSERQPARATLPARFLFVMCIVFVQLIFDALGILINPYKPELEVSFASVRLLAQLSPLLFLALVDLWLIVLARRPSRELSGESFSFLRRVHSDLAQKLTSYTKFT